MAVNLWASADHAREYLGHADAIPHRTEGERALLAYLPAARRRVLDLGSEAGRLLDLVTLAHPDARFTALDFSPTMLERLHARFDDNPAVEIVAHDLDAALPPLGLFDAVVSSFAIHHLAHERKHTLYEEVLGLLAPGGVFCNLEHVASPTPLLHRRFLSTMNIAPGDEDPSNQLLDVQTQLAWLRAIGFVEVDCHWKWMELALLIGTKA